MLVHSFQSQDNVFQMDQFNQEDNSARSNTYKSEATKKTEVETTGSCAHPLGLDLQEQEQEISELKAIIEQLKLVR